ncbi:hypothetical protein BDV93DRAFT_471225 [Ceratobasidium sp. AG-I]|nr:hypothetical protein BDV93DRAFT_471225 [Ceratobasidium sp. AG-I]
MAANPEALGNDIAYHSYSQYRYHSDGGETWLNQPRYDPKYKTSVEVALRAGLRHPSGDFLYALSYPAAPSPGLAVDGVGAIRLPLATDGSDNTYAKRLINACVQAPFGQGERTAVDKEVRDTWQVDAAQVHFTNPAWAKYIDEAMKSVCVTLGVDVEANAPKYEFYKLLVYEEGSHFLPHVDSEKTDGMFATMVVLLPSYFEGGALHLTFNDNSKVVDFGGSASAFQTSVLAWYTDVTHEVKPITGGYRLALTYNLFRTTEPSAVFPAPVNDPALVGLRQALTVWTEAIKQGEDTKAPHVLAWLLEHKYSRASMCLAALKGRDAHLVNRTRLAADELGLCLGLAILTLRVDRPDEEEYGWESDNSEFQNEILRHSWVKFLVNLEGQVVSDRVRFTKDLEGEMMPAGWREQLERLNCDDLDYEHYYGNEGVGEKRWYRRTVLVLWPQGAPPFTKARIENKER